MRTNTRVPQALALVIVFLFVSTIIPLTNATSPPDYSDDGIWTDDFASKNTTVLKNCTWDSSGYIHLKESSVGGRLYTYQTGSNYAGFYRTFLRFFPSPARRTGTEFRNFGYLALKYKNEDQNQYVSTSTTRLQHYAAQLYRFKLDVDGDSAGNVTVEWTGKATNPSIVTLYYWQNYKNIPFGRWIELANSDKNNITFNLNGKVFANDTELAVGSDHYFNVLVVLSSKAGTLSTDYIQIKTSGETGYIEGPGTITSRYSTNLTGYDPYWELVTWDDYHTDNSPLTMQILYKNDDGDLAPIPNDIIPGNEKGFNTSPIYLDNLTIEKIWLRATLSTKDPSRTPELYSWTVLYQPDYARWQDKFSSEFRIDTNQYLNAVPGKINLSAIQGKWPMVGQNPANTRVAEGRGPSNDSLYWFSAIHESTTASLNAPILDGDSLYLTLTDHSHGAVYKYSPVTTTRVGDAFWKNHTHYFTHYLNETCVVSPAIIDNNLIVPTGTMGGDNKIYVFNKNDYNDVPVIYTINDASFWASPIVVNNNLYITTWSGDTSDPDTNSQLIGLHIENDLISQRGNISLPAWSFSTPAYSDNILVVGCHNKDGPSLFAYNVNDQGTIMSERWNATVGAIDRASPVIANGVVYIISEIGSSNIFSDQTQITALSLNNGTSIWDAPTKLGDKVSTPLTWDANDTLADCTPAYYNDNLYLTTPDGQLATVSAKSGTVTKPKTVYNYRRYLDPTLKSSPAIANDIIYFGTPNGTMAAYSINGTPLWAQQTYSSDVTIPVITSPVISNGLVYFAAGNGWIYSYGGYLAPTDKLSGTLISIPIRLPTNYWWNKFYVYDSTAAGKNNITYSLLDENNNLLRTLTNGTSLTSNVSLPRTIRFKAYFQAKNLTVNPSLTRWGVTFSTDSKKPYFLRNTLQPPITSGWVNTIYSHFNVQVKDNDTGLLVTSAKFNIEYYINGTLHNGTYAATCSGSNGTKNPQNFTIDFSQYPSLNNITQLVSLSMSITDLAGNKAELEFIFKQDLYKPTSTITNSKTLKATYTLPFRINATATDNLSGVHNLSLLYRVSTTGTFSGPWTVYSTKNTSRYSFQVTPPTGGYYQFMTKATDNATNIENDHNVSGANLTFDNTPPDRPSFDSIYWFHSDPTFTVTFTDDFRLNTIQYKPNFITGDWITIASNINQTSYTATWTLPEEYWTQMQSNESNYLYFRINDTLGNTLTISDPTQALQMRRDTDKPTVVIEVPTQETFHNTGEHFNITARASDLGSGIQEVELLYRYSSTGNNWTGEWVQFGRNLTAPPYSWDFGADEGEGYYQFQIVAKDRAGNTAESSVISAGIQTFPTEWLVILGVLVALLLILSVFLIRKWKKR
jgi:hypothetical protein